MPPAERARPAVRRLAVAMVATVALGAIAVAATYTPLFAARRISVDTSGLVRDEVLRLAGIDPATNVFHLDVRVAERRLLRDPRILDATVATSLPDRIDIHVTPRVPVAVVGAPPVLVGGDGVLIGPAGSSSSLPSIRRSMGGPVSAMDREAAAAAIAAMTPDLRRRVDAVLVDAEGAIEVLLRIGFAARLGDPTELRAKAASLAALLDWVREEGVAVASADLTVPGSPTAQLAGTSSAVPVD
jgi:cell division septal protein FtsQ